MKARAFVHMETTPPVLHICLRCRRTVLYGLAEGIPARADIVPISGPQEAVAAAAGRPTYTLRRSGLIQRDPVRRADPALASPVLAAHACPAAGVQQLALPLTNGAPR